MKYARKKSIVLALSLWAFTAPSVPFAADAIVYSVYKGIDLGNPNDESQKDFFINLGTQDGIQPGTIVEVSRRSPSYDLTTEKLYKDLVYPIARLKVIHAEKDAAIARLDRMYPADKTPVLNPRAIIVGDLVKPVK